MLARWCRQPRDSLAWPRETLKTSAARIGDCIGNDLDAASKVTRPANHDGPGVKRRRDRQGFPAPGRPVPGHASCELRLGLPGWHKARHLPGPGHLSSDPVHARCIFRGQPVRIHALHETHRCGQVLPTSGRSGTRASVPQETARLSQMAAVKCDQTSSQPLNKTVN